MFLVLKVRYLYVVVYLHFLSRVSTLARYIDIAILSVRPSVHGVPVFYGNGLR